MAKATHEEAQYRCGRLGRRCCNCTMFRWLADDERGEGEAEYGSADDEASEYSCTAVVSPIRPKDLCDYFVESEALPR
jgi:hypothetical protein